MHRSPSARGRRRGTRVGAARGLRARTLEDGTATLDASCCAFRGQIDWSRPSLGHHNPPGRSLGNGCVGRGLNRFRIGFNFHHIERGFDGGRHHRRSIARLCRSCCTGCSGDDGRRCRHGNNLRGNMLCTLGSCCNISRGVCLGWGCRWLSGRRRLCRCRMGRGWGSNHHRRTRNDGSHGRLAHNRRWRRRRSHNLGVLPWLWHNPSGRWGRCRSSARRQHRFGFRCSLGNHGRCCCNRRRRLPARWRTACLLRTHLCGKYDC